MTEIASLLITHYPLLLALMGAGALAGLMAGLFGVGGGMVIVPVLFSILHGFGYPSDIAMRVALGTSLATIVPTGFSSARAHWKRGGVSPEILRLLTPSTIAGAVLGSCLAGVFPARLLTFFFAGFASYMAFVLMRGRKGFALARELPRGAGRHALGGGIGFISSILGLGGGGFSVPTLVACGYAMPIAVGSGAALGLAIAIPGSLGYLISGWGHDGLPPFSFGYVNLPAMALIAPLSALIAPFGAHLAHKLPEIWLRRGFAIFLTVVAIKMTLKALG